MEKEQLKEEIKKEIKKESKGNVIIGILTILVILLAGYIVYTDFIMKQPKTNEPEQKEEQKETIEITDAIKSELNNILGFSETRTNYTVDEWDRIMLKGSGVINELTLEEKKSLVYGMIYRNKLYTVVKGEEYEYCMAGKGTCEGVTEEHYKMAAAKYGITNTYSEMFASEYQQYNNMYLLYNGGTALEGDISVKLTYVSTEEGIEVINDYTITPYDGYKETIRKTYLFKNNGTSYYLYSIK